MSDSFEIINATDSDTSFVDLSEDPILTSSQSSDFSEISKDSLDLLFEDMNNHLCDMTSQELLVVDSIDKYGGFLVTSDTTTLAAEETETCETIVDGFVYVDKKDEGSRRTTNDQGNEGNIRRNVNAPASGKSNEEEQGNVNAVQRHQKHDFTGTVKMD